MDATPNTPRSNQIRVASRRSILTFSMKGIVQQNPPAGCVARRGKDSRPPTWRPHVCHPCADNPAPAVQRSPVGARPPFRRHAHRPSAWIREVQPAQTHAPAAAIASFALSPLSALANPRESTPRSPICAKFLVTKPHASDQLTTITPTPKNPDRAWDLHAAKTVVVCGSDCWLHGTGVCR
jgi:hypothetical protein